jgi:hypothetical protein
LRNKCPLPSRVVCIDAGGASTPTAAKKLFFK